MKYAFITIALFTLNFSYGQTNDLVKARTLQAEGKVEDALSVIKKALETDTFKQDGGAWYTYAELNRSLFKKQSEPEFLREAIKGYQQTLQYPSPNTRINVSAQQSVNQIYQELIQKGAQLYQEQQYKDALFNFESALIIEPKDSTIITYAANAAVQAKSYTSALENFRKLQEIKPKESIYQSMLSIQKDLQKDFKGALETIELAKQDFPGSQTYDRYKLDILLLSSQNKEAIDVIVELLTKSPKDDKLLLRKAVLHDALVKEIKAKTTIDSLALQKETEMAEEAYLETLSLSPESIVANFNLAMLYTDRANEYYKAINSMTMDSYQKNAKGYEAKALNFIRKALPLMEVAAKKEKGNLNILKALVSYYTRLGLGEKKRKIEAEIQALNESN